MRIASLSSRSFLALALLGVIAASACKNDEGGGEPNVSSVRLTVGTATITVSSTGTVTGGPIVITRPTAPTITASFLTAAGTVDPIGNGTDFQLNVTSANTAVLTFARAADFSGTLFGVAAGSTTITVSLFHKVEQHDDFGPFTVPVTVN